MAAFSMTGSQMRFPILTWTRGGVAVDPATVTPTFTSSDAAVVAWEMRKADGSMPDATDPGRMAVVAHVPKGTATVAIRVTNADTSFFEQTGEFTVAPLEQPVGNVDGGSLDFEPALEQPHPAHTASRRRS